MLKLVMIEGKEVAVHVHTFSGLILEKVISVFSENGSFDKELDSVFGELGTLDLKLETDDPVLLKELMEIDEINAMSVKTFITEEYFSTLQKINRKLYKELKKVTKHLFDRNKDKPKFESGIVISSEDIEKEYVRYLKTIISLQFHEEADSIRDFINQFEILDSSNTDSYSDDVTYVIRSSLFESSEKLFKCPDVLKLVSSYRNIIRDMDHSSKTISDRLKKIRKEERKREIYSMWER